MHPNGSVGLARSLVWTKHIGIGAGRASVPAKREPSGLPAANGARLPERIAHSPVGRRALGCHGRAAAVGLCWPQR